MQIPIAPLSKAGDSVDGSARAQPDAVVLACLCLFDGVTSIWRGVSMAAWPYGPPVAPPLSLLSGTPFRDYFVPGLLLVGSVGITATLSGYLALCRAPRAGRACSIAGAIQLIWSVAELALVGFVSWVQLFYLTMGVAIVVIAAHHERWGGDLREVQTKRRTVGGVRSNFGNPTEVHV